MPSLVSSCGATEYTLRSRIELCRYTAPVIRILHGDDSYSRTRALARILAELSTGNADVSRYDASVAIDALIFALQTTPFLASRRIVIVDGLLTRAQPRRDGARRGRGGGRRGGAAPFWAALADAAPTLPPSTELILLDDGADRDNPLKEALTPHAQVTEFRPLRGRDLQAWLTAHARDAGVHVLPETERLLIELCGSNLWALAGEVEKLHLYVGDEHPATAADVRALASSVREASVFSLVDAVIEGHNRNALRLLQQLRIEGAGPGYIITMVTRQCRLLILARELSARGLGQPEIGQRIGVTNDFALSKVMQQSARSSLPWLEAAMARLLEADLALKRGEQSEELAIELAVADLAQPA